MSTYQEAQNITHKDIGRFTKKFIIKDSGCWEWTGSIGTGYNDGYGKFWMRSIKRVTNAHRFSYQLIKGDIPERFVLDHLCRNRKCVNPKHLQAVTQQENILRGETEAYKNSKKTHCYKGHKFTPDNTYAERKHGKYTGRICRECKLAKARENYIMKVNQGFRKGAHGWVN